MTEINNEKVIKGEGPVSGVILTREEYDDLCEKHRKFKQYANNADADNDAAKKDLDLLCKVKREKEASLANLKRKYDEREEEFEHLDTVIEHRQRLYQSLSRKEAKDD